MQSRQISIVGRLNWVGIFGLNVRYHHNQIHRVFLSSLDHLKEPLAAYMHKLGKVRIIRTRRREGLIRARLIGVAAALAPTLTFLDSHIECFPGKNWNI